MRSTKTIPVLGPSLLQRARSGDHQAWQSLLRMHFPALVQHVRTKTGDPTATRWVVGRTVEVAYRRLDECPDLALLGQWLLDLASREADGLH